MGPGPRHGGQVKARFLSETARERRSKDAIATAAAGCLRFRAATCRAAIAAHLRVLGIRFAALDRGVGFRVRIHGATLGIARRCRIAFAPALGGLGDVFTLGRQNRDHGIDLHALGACRHDDLGENAFVDRLDLHRRLVGLDLGDDVARRDLVAFLLQPFGEVALLHGRRQSGHGDVDRHGRLRTVLSDRLLQFRPPSSAAREWVGERRWRRRAGQRPRHCLHKLCSRPTRRSSE